MEESNEKILWEGYGLRFYGGTRTRTGLVCKTDKGPRELKKARGRVATICFAHDVKECLYHNGFTTISRFYSTTEGQPCYTKDGILYVLEELLPATPLAEDGVEAFIQGAEVLGRMHCCAKGVHSEFVPWEKERLPGQFEKRHTELAKIKRRIQKQGGYDVIDLLVLRCYEEYMEQTSAAQRYLEQANYIVQVTQAEKEGAFCHNSFKGENLRVGHDGKIFVGGFENCSADVPLMDLAAYLKRYMKKTDGGQAGVIAMMNAYAKNCVLTEKELDLLHALVIYPEKFLRLTNEYYNKRRACVSQAMQERLSSAVDEEKQTRKLALFLRKG